MHYYTVDPMLHLTSTIMRIRSDNDIHQWSNYQKVFRGAYGKRRVRAYNEGLGAEPPAGSGGRAPVQGAP